MKEMTLIRKFLKTKYHNSTYTLSTPLICNYTLELDGTTYQLATKVKYVFLRENIPFAADEKWDEIALNCLNKNHLERIVSILNEN